MFTAIQTNYRGADNFQTSSPGAYIIDTLQDFKKKLNYLQNYYRHPANKVKSLTKQLNLLTLLLLIYTLYHILFEGLLIHHSHLKI